MREWLTVIIVLLIVGILLDGWRRMRRARYSKIHMSRKLGKGSGKASPDTYGSELPGGGARVVAQRDEGDARRLNREVKEALAASKLTSGAPSRMPEQVSLNLDEAVPMLMEVEPDLEPELEQTSNAEPESSTDNLAAQELEEASEATLEDERVEDGIEDEGVEDEILEPSFENESQEGSLQVETRQVDTHVNTRIEPSLNSSSAAATESQFAEERSEPSVEAIVEEAPEPEEVIIINVMARKGDRFNGAALLDTLLTCGMRFGDMNIFHRHENEEGVGPVLFSMANMVKPGIFDLNTMDQFETPGVSLFMTLPMSVDSMRAFNAMASTAEALRVNLDGELKDKDRSVMTKQTIEHYRQSVRDFERKQLSRV